jgi:hypothetical protein
MRDSADPFLVAVRNPFRATGACQIRKFRHLTGLFRDVAHRYRRRQVKTEDIAKFQTKPTAAPATPASHHAWLEVKA